MPVQVRRYGIEEHVAEDARLCDECCKDYGVEIDRDGEVVEDGEFEGCRLYWLTDEAEEGFTKCEDCGMYHGEPYPDEEEEEW